MIAFDKETIKNLEYLNKINLVNSACGYKSANLIGTKSKAGISNLAIFSSVTHFGSEPAIYGFVLRPTTVRRNTYDNIKETGIFTLNPVFEEKISDAHHTSAKYADETSEFDKTSFTEEYKENWNAPFVKNAPLQIAMKFLEEVHIKANGTILILASVEKIHVRKEMVSEDYFINLSKGKIAAISGLDAYSVPEKISRFPYQRPKK
ncbi:MAG: flavin reductase [Polaribacter sp.]|jgi:flavin reductase (DIM6/NTAB) family NADH-FMN oxidoreductase RutF|nr:flavin reductase [Polaribacter sp.]MDG1953515.1 flavin reductase [Polaribacter sp.]MDG2073767.1 flavin reductase [Polaribacter sp.]